MTDERINREQTTFYKDVAGNLYRENQSTKTYKQVNLQQWKFITREEFKGLNLQRISRHKFNELMNIYYKNNKLSWTYNGMSYRQLDNFELDKFGNITNYLYGYTNVKKTKDKMVLPLHKINDHCNWAVIVVFKGKVCYMAPYHNGGHMIFDIVTKKFKGWCTIKNCSPVLNRTTGNIC